MPEKLRTERSGFQVWKNPQGFAEPVYYLGEFLPPSGCDVLTSNDLRDLGFVPGSYTVGARSDEPHQFDNWTTIFITE